MMGVGPKCEIAPKAERLPLQLEVAWYSTERGYFSGGVR